MSKESITIEEIIQSYLKRGFGSMNKNDFEVWIFNEWRKLQDKNLSDYAISKELKISETKVKRLRYEADLKYSSDNDDDKLQEHFFELLKTAKYKKENSKLQFVIKDKLLRGYISDCLEKDGRFMDSSFNANMVSIYVDDFSFLLEQFKEVIDTDKIIKEAEKKAESYHDFPVKFSDIIKEKLKDLGKEYVGELTTESICNFIKGLKNKQ